MTLTRRTLAATAVVASLSLVGCSQSGWGERHGIKDAPIEPTAEQNNGPAHVITFPDGFANITVKCDRGVAIYTSTRQAPPVVVVGDPHCAGGN